MTPEEAQALLGGASNIDAAAGQDQAAAGSQAASMVLVQQQNAAMEWVWVPELLAMVITTALPETDPMYTPEKNLALAEKLAVVAEKRGWGGSNTPEIALGIAAVGFMAPAYLAYQHRKAMAEIARQEREKGAGKPLGAADGS